MVDVPSQAYGYREELIGVHQALAAAIDAYAAAREAGHPVVALMVGKAVSGASLAHGLQANRLIALDDDGVQVHVMSKQSAARITRRTIAELDEAPSYYLLNEFMTQDTSRALTLEQGDVTPWPGAVPRGRLWQRDAECCGRHASKV